MVIVRNFLCFTIFIVIIAITNHQSAIAQTVASPTPCDTLAASDIDPDAKAPGVYWFKIDYQKAIDACYSAIAEGRKVGRYHFQLGRALELKAWHTDDRADYRAAVSAYQTAIDFDHVAAFAALAGLYQHRSGDPDDLKQILLLRQQGHLRGDPAAAALYAEMLALGIEVAEPNCPAAQRAIDTARKVPNRVVLSILGVWYRDGICADAPDFIQAEAALRQSATLGDPYAMSNLGALLQKRATPDSLREALKLYERAADLGHGQAARNAGWLHGNGVGVPQDDARAVDWYRRGVALKSTTAMWALGYMLRLGRTGGAGQDPDPKAAEEWYAKARSNAMRKAQFGDAFEMEHLARLLWQGNGGPIDKDGALEWAARAAKRGNADAINYQGFILNTLGRYTEANTVFQNGIQYRNSSAKANLGNNIRLGSGLENPDVNRGKAFLIEAADEGDGWAAHVLSAIAFAERNFGDARRYLERGVTLNYEDSIIGLAIKLSASGDNIMPGFETDLPRARSLFERAAALGSSWAMYAYAERLRDRVFGQTDPAIVYSWYLRAAKLGHEDAISERVVPFLLNGTGVEKNATEAVRWLKRSVELKNPSAMWQLAQLYRDGYDGNAPDREAAISLMIHAADADNSDAMHDLGVLYVETKQPADLVTAYGWFLKGALAGDADSMVEAGQMLERGTGVEPDAAAAVGWYEKAAAEDHVDGMIRFAIALQQGTAVPRDIARSRNLLARVLAEERNSWAMYQLAVSYDENEPRNAVIAANAAVHAVSFGSKTALRSLIDDADQWQLATRIEVQRRLTAMAGYTGAVNGTFNPATKAALERLFNTRVFQESPRR